MSGSAGRTYEEDGEAASCQLELTLNDIGQSFLTLDDHLATED